MGDQNKFWISGGLITLKSKPLLEGVLKYQHISAKLYSRIVRHAVQSFGALKQCAQEKVHTPSCLKRANMCPTLQYSQRYTVHLQWKRPR